MGHDLKNKEGKAFRWNMAGWGLVFDTAQDYGWRPSGTVLAEDDRWEGGYFTNDGQWVREDDAAFLADALELALEDAEVQFQWTEGMQEKVGSFIGFCRQGGFEIW